MNALGNISGERREAIRRLLDDPSPPVRRAIMDELSRWEDSGVAFLQEVAADGRLEEREVAASLLREFGVNDPVSALREFIRSFNYELETGAIMLSRLRKPALMPEDIIVFLDDMAKRVRELTLESSTGWERCRVLNQVMFHEFGFRGDAENFYDPANSFLHSVIERRRGIPITLSMIYLLVAGRVGLDLEPVGLPGRFMVGCFSDIEPFFVDVFEGGVFRSVEDIEVMLETYQIDPDPIYLAPSPVGEVLLRCCRNLVNAFERQGDEASARLFESFAYEFESAYQRYS